MGPQTKQIIQNTKLNHKLRIKKGDHKNDKIVNETTKRQKNPL